MQTDRKETGACLDSEQIVSFHEGELSADDRERFEAHLASCEKCTQDLADFGEMISVLAENSSEEKCDVADAVMTRIAGSAGQTAGITVSFGWGLVRAAALLAVALMLGIMVSGVFKRGSAPQRASQAAVEDAAEWLVSVQDEDGSWNPVKWGGRRELGASLTGLAMLTVMRSGIDAKEPLAQAEQYLLSIQNADGSFGPECSGSLYNHGIASKALLELRKEGIGKAGEELDRAVAYIKMRQAPSGGWSYREDDSRNSSLGVSVWQLDALMAGRDAGMKGLNGSLRNGLVWLNGAYSGKGDFNYRHGRDDLSPTVKAMGAMCMLSADKDVLGSLDSAKINEALTGAFSEGTDHRDPYKSYFIASAVKASGGKSLAGGLADMRDAIAERRITHGVNAGSWDADVKWGSVGGRIYSTSMAALALSNGGMGDI